MITTSGENLGIVSFQCDVSFIATALEEEEEAHMCQVLTAFLFFLGKQMFPRTRSDSSAVHVCVCFSLFGRALCQVIPH